MDNVENCISINGIQGNNNLGIKCSFFLSKKINPHRYEAFCKKYKKYLNRIVVIAGGHRCGYDPVKACTQKATY